VMNSVVMANVTIEDNVIIDKAVIGNNSVIRKNTVVGNSEDIALIGAGREIKTNGVKGV